MCVSTYLAEEVEYNVRKHWFGYFGLPKELQSDNGNEFKNKVFVSSVYKWQGSCEVNIGWICCLKLCG